MAILIAAALAWAAWIPRADARKGPSAELNLAVRPVPQPRAWWAEHHKRINLEVKERGDAELIFVGDSLTSLWRFNGRRTWRRYYAQRDALNLGAAGDQIQHTLWRLQNGNLQGLSPRLAVLMVGVNNIYQPVKHVVSGLRLTVNYLRRRLPRTRLLVLGILPFGERPGRQRIKIKQVNRALAAMADGRWIHFLDIGHLFVEPNGSLTPGLMTHDFLHLNPLGYELWAGAMEPKLVQLLGEDPASLRHWRIFGLHHGSPGHGGRAPVDADAAFRRALSPCRAATCPRGWRCQ